MRCSRVSHLLSRFGHSRLLDLIATQTCCCCIMYDVWWAERYEPNSIGQNKTTQPLQPSFSYLIFGCFVCAEPHVVCLLFHDAWKLSLKGTVLRQVLWSRRENVRNIFCLARLHWFVFVHSHARRFSYRAWKYIFENVSLDCHVPVKWELN